MKKTILSILLLLMSLSSSAQVNTDRVMMIGRNALYFEDYVLAIQYFNQVIQARPHLAQPFYYRAVAKFMLDDFEGAEEDATACLDRNPFYIAAYQLRGAARQNLGKFELAAADYMRSLEFFPEDRLTLINMAIVNVEMEYFDVADRFFDLLVRRYPQYSPTFIVRSQMRLQQNDTISAMADLNRAIEIDPYTSQPFSMRGLLHFQQKDYESALADFNRSIEIDPFFEGNYINRGLVQYYLNNLREAMANYDRVIEMDSRNLIARFNRGLLRAQVADNNNAIEDFNVVIELDPYNMAAFLNRAMLNSEVGNTVSAINDLDVVLAEHSDFFSGLFMRSQLKRELGDLRGAERDFNLARAEEARARRIATENPEPLVRDANERDTREQSDRDIERFNLLVVADREESSSNRGNTHQRQSRGRVQNQVANITPESRFVLTYYERDREIPRPLYFSPALDDANRTLGLSWILRATNNEAPLNELQIEAHFRSIDNYFRKLDTDPNNAALYFGRAIDFMLILDYENALSDINRVIDLKPDFAMAYFVRAVIRSKQLDFNPLETEDLFSANSSSATRTPEQRITTGMGTLPTLPEIYTRTFEHDAIMRDYEKVIALNPSFFFAHYNIAEIFTLERDYRAAITAYTRAIELEPRFAEAYFNRGISRLSIGETAAGLEDLRQAGQLGIVQAYSIMARMR